MPTLQIQRISGELIEVPNFKKTILIFWSTDCFQCSIELDELNNLMSIGQLKNDQIIAINTSENKEKIKNFIDKSNYQFLVAVDYQKQSIDKLHISHTPTILFIDEKNIIEWMTTWVSPTLNYRVKNFLKN